MVRTVSWVLNDKGDWRNPQNWSTGTVPGAGDTVVLASQNLHTVVHSTGTDEVGTILARNDKLQVTGGTLTVDGVSDLARGLSMDGGVLRLKADTTVEGPLLGHSGVIDLAVGTTLSLLDGGAWQSGSPSSLANGLALTIEGPGTLVTTGTVDLVQYAFDGQSGLTWVNRGDVVGVSNEQGYAQSVAGSRLINTRGGTIDLSDFRLGALPVFLRDVREVLINQGVLHASGTTDTVEEGIDTSGTIEVATGTTLLLDGGGAIGGTISGGGVVELESGQFTWSNPVIQGGARVVLSSATLTVADGQTIAGVGFIGRSNPATDPLPVIKGAGVFLAQPGDVPLFGLADGVTFRNTGILNLTGLSFGASLRGTNVLANARGAQLNLTGPSGLFDISTTRDGSGLVRNYGQINVANGADIGISALIDTVGSINLASATLELAGGGTLGGSVRGIGTIDLDAGLFRLPNLSTSAGIDIKLDGGTVQVDAGSSVSSLRTVTYGTLTGAGVIATAGTVNLVDSRTDFSSGPTALIDASLSWRNSGDLVVHQYELEFMRSAGKASGITNLAGAHLQIDSASTLLDQGKVDHAGASGATLTNFGTLSFVGVSSSYSTSAEIDIRLVNTGLITVTDGDSPMLAGGGSLGGTITGTGQVFLTGGNWSFAAPVIGSGIHVVLAGGTVSLADAPLPDFLQITSGVVEGPGTWVNHRSLVLGPSGYTSIIFTGGATLDNAGTLTLALNGLALANGASLVNERGAAFYLSAPIQSLAGPASRFINHGLLHNDADTISAFFQNDGTVDGNSAGSLSALSLAGGGSLGGVFRNEFSISLSDGSYALQSTAELDTKSLSLSGAVLTIGGDRSFTGVLDVGTSTDPFDGVPGVRGTIDGPGTLAVATVTLDLAVLGGGIVLDVSGQISVQNLTLGDASGGGVVRLDSFSVLSLGGGAQITAAGSGGQLVNAGLIISTGDASSPTNVGVAVQNDGVIRDTSGTLELSGGVTGLGSIEIGTNALVRATTLGGQTIAFDGSHATLELDVTTAGTIATRGLVAGDAIDLRFAGSAIATITADKLSIKSAGGSALTFLSSSSLAGETAHVIGDGLGGTLVSIIATPTAAVMGAVASRPLSGSVALWHETAPIWTPPPLHHG